MRLSSLSSEEASALSVRALGLDSELIDLTSQEGLAASLRRAASFMCPTNPGRLLNAVLSAVRPVSIVLIAARVHVRVRYQAEIDHEFRSRPDIDESLASLLWNERNSVAGMDCDHPSDPWESR